MNTKPNCPVCDTHLDNARGFNGPLQAGHATLCAICLSMLIVNNDMTFRVAQDGDGAIERMRAFIQEPETLIFLFRRAALADSHLDALKAAHEALRDQVNNPGSLTPMRARATLQAVGDAIERANAEETRQNGREQQSGT